VGDGGNSARGGHSGVAEAGIALRESESRGGESGPSRTGGEGQGGRGSATRTPVRPTHGRGWTPTGSCVQTSSGGGATASSTRSRGKVMPPKCI